MYIFHSVEYFCPILNYLSEIRGYKGFPKSENVHNRAIRLSLGAHKYAHILSVNGPMGWD